MQVVPCAESTTRWAASLRTRIEQRLAHVGAPLHDGSAGQTLALELVTKILEVARRARFHPARELASELHVPVGQDGRRRRLRDDVRKHDLGPLGPRDAGGCGHDAVGSRRAVERDQNPSGRAIAIGVVWASDDQDRPPRRPEDLLRRAAERPRGKAALTVASERDEIGIELAGDRRDPLGGLSLLEPAVDAKSRRPCRRSLEALEVRATFLP